MEQEHEKDKKFFELLLEGKVKESDIYSYTELWHTSDDKGTLYDYLGLTEEQYDHWLLTEQLLLGPISKTSLN